MKGRKTINRTLIVLLFSSIFVSVGSLNETKKQMHTINDDLNEINVDVPVWSIGESWIYDVQ